MLIISSLLNIAYLLPVAINAFFLPDEPETTDDGAGHEHAHGDSDDHGHGDNDSHGDHGHGHGGFWLERLGLQEAPAFCVIPLCLTALACVALFVYPDPFLELARAIRLG